MLIEWAMARLLKDGYVLSEDTRIEKGMPLTKRASERVISNCSVFRKTDVYLDVCSQFEYMRGMLGLAVGLIPGAMLCGAGSFSSYFVMDWIRGTTPDGEAYGWDHNVAGIFGIAVFLGLFLLFKKFAWPLINKDYFTSRRVLIRFNRITRKVYIHRPKYAGGVATYDWDTMDAVLDNQGGKDNPSNGRLVVNWIDVEARKMTGFEFIGRAAGNEARGKAWWEYIRRYMEEGADSVPKPFPRLWKGPWPHMSILEVFYLYPERLLNGGPVWWIGLMILAPVDLFRALLHWIAMLTCVEPKFPPEIENAGQPAIGAHSA